MKAPAPLTVREAVALSGRSQKTILALIKTDLLKAEKDPTWPGARRYLIDPKSFESVVLAAAGQPYIRPHPGPGPSSKWNRTPA